MAVAGASRFLNAATLANVRGLSPTTDSLLSGSAAGGVADLLSNARVNNGIGLSARARAQTNQFLSQSASGFNTIFSLNGTEFGTNETLQQKILAIRAGIPDSQLAPSLRGEIVDEEA